MLAEVGPAGRTLRPPDRRHQKEKVCPASSSDDGPWPLRKSQSLPPRPLLFRFHYPTSYLTPTCPSIHRQRDFIFPLSTLSTAPTHAHTSSAPDRPKRPSSRAYRTWAITPPRQKTWLPQ
ncbi:uncharacterized protein K452DRAFT_64563 [Aplosporella prunicola CBS 121167]|uniref:Uncharacterized protein n=1 Tax=Aplosporella prunicola CBS 121167 TaxID=1176127 RepID=A0A6A6B9Y0_9PEZI|nr:uncharacterized protein K452DRAFT_64563 [Aplosporella prunicola CBS 121167]KAF2139717.1 hypothetical protein K452DRAFT_64563 [Aplosporella prunicola CBS 121167]